MCVYFIHDHLVKSYPARSMPSKSQWFKGHSKLSHESLLGSPCAPVEMRLRTVKHLTRSWSANDGDGRVLPCEVQASLCISVMSHIPPSSQLSIGVFFPLERAFQVCGKARGGRKGQRGHPTQGDTSYQICLVVNRSP